MELSDDYEIGSEEDVPAQKTLLGKRKRSE
jgi:hypothetical protein